MCLVFDLGSLADFAKLADPAHHSMLLAVGSVPHAFAHGAVINATPTVDKTCSGGDRTL